MSNITIKNGILIGNLSNYSIYEMYTEDAADYYMCIPNGEFYNYTMIIDFPEAYYKSLLKNEIKEEIIKHCNVLYQEKRNYIYLLPNIDGNVYHEAKSDNNNKTYQLLMRNISKYTYNAYKSIINENIKINQVIDIVIDTDDDIKFVGWLDMMMDGYFNGVNLQNNTLDSKIDNDDSGTSIGSISGNPQESTNEMSKNKNSHKTKVLIPNKHGYTTTAFAIVVLLLAFVIGIYFAWLFVK